MKSTFRGTLLASALIAFGASTAVAEEIPVPGLGDGGLILAAWDDTQSYVLDLGSTFGSFNLNASVDFGILPDWTNYFADLSQVQWSVTAADNTPDGTFTGIGFLTTGSVGSAITNGGVGTVAGAINNFVGDTNGEFGGCMGPCQATVGNLSFAGRDSFGNTLNLPGLVNSGSGLGDSADFLLVQQVGGFVFNAASITVAPGQWLLSSDGNLSYVVPVPAAVWLFGSAVFGLGFARRRGASK